MDWFISDLHLNHELVVKTRNFPSMEKMNETLLHMFDVVKKGDNIYLLGDVAWDADGAKMLFDYLIMKKKVGKVVLAEGNHDKNWLGKIDLHPRVEVCQTMLIKSQHKNGFRSIFISHYPQMIYDKSHHGAYQLHGHGHMDTIDRPMLDALQMGKRINVNCELHNYKLWSRSEIEETMKSKPENIDCYLCHGNDRQKKQVMKMLDKINKILKGLNKLGDIDV